VGYLKCDSCEGRYDLQPGELPGDFIDECTCGGKLEFYDDRGQKRLYKDVYSPGSQRKSDIVKEFLILFVKQIFIFVFGFFAIFYYLFYGSKFLEPIGGTYLFVIFFGICFAAILGLLWFLNKKK
jgi:hypothetical protein